MNIANFYKNSVYDLRNAGIQTAELDAKVLLKFVLESDESFLLMHPEMPLTNYQFSKLKKLLKRRLNNEPIAYLTGHKEFFGHDFLVNKNVLIPRPETEFLVEQALKILKTKDQSQKTKVKILDIGTGSGCIVISLILELEKQCSNVAMKQLRFFASEISKKSLYVAKKNAKQLLNNETIEQLNNVKFYHSDLFTNRLLHKKYDLIIANLPYVPLPCHPPIKSGAGSRANNDLTSFESEPEGSSLRVEDRGFRQNGQHNFMDSRFHGNDSILYEPQEAIFADDNGAAIIKKLLNDAKKYLNYDGVILLELDPRSATDIQKFATKNYPNAKISLQKDLAGLKRYLMVES